MTIPTQATDEGGNHRWREAASLAAHRFATGVEQHAGKLAALFSVLFLIVCLLRAATKLLWFDELGMYYAAKLLPMADLQAFFREGLDNHPPGPVLLVRAAIGMLGDHHSVARLPFSLGYLLMCLCIYRFVSRRCPRSYGLAAMLFPMILPTVYYATEIRGYGIVLGMTGVALVSWQELAENRRRVLAACGLLASLAFALCCHYYAILLWIPLGLAELSRSWKTRRIDYLVWASMILALSPLILLRQGIQAAHAAYGASVWNPPSLSGIENSYLEFLSLGFAPLFAAAVLWMMVKGVASVRDGGRFFVPAHERILAGSLALMPVFAVPLSFVTGSFSARYALPTIVGLAIFLAFAMCRSSQRDLALSGVVVVALFGSFVLKAGGIRQQAAQNGGLGVPIGEPLRRQPWMHILESSQLPIAATTPVFFLQLQHYAPPPVRERISYLADRKLAIEVEGADTNDLNLLQLSRRLPIRVAPYRDYVASHPHFLLCADTTWQTWQLAQLRKEGAQLVFLTRSGTIYVFEVFCRQPASAG